MEQTAERLSDPNDWISLSHVDRATHDALRPHLQRRMYQAHLAVRYLRFKARRAAANPDDAPIFARIEHGPVPRPPAPANDHERGLSRTWLANDLARNGGTPLDTLRAVIAAGDEDETAFQLAGLGPVIAEQRLDLCIDAVRARNQRIFTAVFDPLNDAEMSENEQREMLFDAAECGNVPALRHIAAAMIARARNPHGIEPDEPDFDDDDDMDEEDPAEIQARRAIHAAARGGDVPAFKAVMEIPGVTLNALDETGRSAALLAVEFAHLPLLRHLATLPDPENPDDLWINTQDALEKAIDIADSSPEVLAQLLRTPGVNIFGDLPGFEGPGHRYALYTDNLKAFEMYWHTEGFDRVGINDDIDENHLETAILYEAAQCVRYLLEKSDLDVAAAVQEVAIKTQRADPTMLRDLIAAKKIELNAVDFQGNTPLMRAIMYADVPAVRTLLAAPDVDVNTRCGQANQGTALLFAVHKGQLDITAALLAHRDADGRLDLDVNARNQHGQSALHLAAFQGNEGLAQLLLADERTDCNALSADEISPIATLLYPFKSEAVRTRCLQVFAANPKVNVNCVFRGESIVNHVINHASPGMLQALLQRSDLWSRINTDTPKISLFVALKVDRPDMVALLLADSRVRESFITEMHGFGPLHAGAMCNVSKSLPTLLAAHAEWRQNPIDEALTPVGLAALKNNHRFLDRYLALADVDISTPNNSGYLPVHTAAANDAPEAMNVLRREMAARGIDMHATDSQALIHIAAKHNAQRALHELLADPTIDVNAATMSGGETALHYAVHYGHVPIIQKLLENPTVDALAVNILNHTPTHQAILLDSPSALYTLSNVRDQTRKPNFQATMEFTLRNNAPNCTQLLLVQTRANILYHGTGQNSIVQTILKSGNLKALKLLLKRNDCPADLLNERVSPPLHWALANDIHAFNMLLEDARIDPNVHDSRGFTTLHLGIFRKDMRAVRALLNDPRTDCSLLDPTGKTYAHYILRECAEPEREALLKQLLQHDAAALRPKHRQIDWSHRDREGLTPFQLTAALDNPQALRMLAGYPRVNRHARTADGYEAIHLAVLRDADNALVELLDMPQTNINAQDGRNRTAFDLAEEVDAQRCRAILFAYQTLNHSPLP